MRTVELEIDEARRDEEPVGRNDDRAVGSRQGRPDGHDCTVDHQHVGGRDATSADDGAAGDEQRSHLAPPATAGTTVSPVNRCHAR